MDANALLFSFKSAIVKTPLYRLYLMEIQTDVMADQK